MSRLTLAAVAAALLAAAVSAADEPVLLKQSEPRKAGDKVRCTETETSMMAADFVVFGMKSDQKGTGSKKIVYVEEVVTAAGKADDRPLKLVRTYEKYEVADDGKEETGPPLKTPITIEKTGAAYAFDAGAKKLDREFLEKLDKEFNPKDKGDGNDVTGALPDKPVKPGHTWELPREHLPFFAAGGDTDMKLDEKKLVAKAKFVKVVTRGGRPFAEIEYTIAAPILSLGKDDDFRVTEGSFSAKLGIELALDGRPGGGTTTKNAVAVKMAGKGSTFSMKHESTNATTEELLNK